MKVSVAAGKRSLTRSTSTELATMASTEKASGSTSKAPVQHRKLVKKGLFAKDRKSPARLLSRSHRD